ncbi:MAG: DNA topoisomerase IB [Legionella sp.]|uniref:DNA topoisomerase IB n=1 Tax=Legionella sp. TaxID=459 RepID=UPI00283E36A5|nr:DNA topoisomerase IB [Legionella sp.]
MNKNSCFVYVKQTPGIQRKKQGKNFVYFDSKGKRITDSKVLERIKLLAIPPAYTHVWICSNEKGHIQAVGRDNKNRKQYIYHASWVQRRQEQKFKSLLDFGYSLSTLREKINEEISSPPTLDKSQIICAVLFLIDNYSVRIGNSAYAKQNKTYGITTLRKKHMRHKKNAVSFEFLGKNKHPWNFEVTEKNLIQILKQCNHIPGYEIFKYYNEQQHIAVITSQDVNEYLQRVTQHPFTAKDFRTWIATREFFVRAISLLEIKNLKITHIKHSMLEVAALLGHTPSICKTSYIHPQIFEWLKNGKLMKWKRKNQQNIKTKKPDELLLLWLEEVYHL